MMFKALVIALAVVLLLVAVVVVIGYLLPVGHVAARNAILPQPPDRVFALLTDVEEYPRWRSDVQRVELLSRDSPRRWIEHGRNGDITFEVVASESPRRLVARIADRSLPFGGTWTYELVPEGDGTRLTITEHGQVFNPVFRFMSRFVFGHTATLDRYIRDLQQRMVLTGAGQN
jgi:uncharacterized protein YndB with AHSA1/START domain